MNRDLTVGNPQKVLWAFCLPLFGSVVFQQLYNIADSLVVGQFVSENALAAVGNSYEITLIFLAFAFGCNMGCSVITSRFFGAKDYANMKTAISTSIIASAAFCAAVMLVGLLGSNALLNLINTPAEVYADSKLYLDIYVYGLPFVFFYNIATGIFSAFGDSKTPLIFLAVSSCSNVFVDILFVTAFQMGVAGVAWATFLCQGASCILSLLFVYRRIRAMKTTRKPALFSGSMLKHFFVIAIPSMLQQSFISIGNMFIQSFINGFGPAVMAGYSVSVKFNNLIITSFTTISNGVSNYAAQNLGAGKLPRVSEGFKAAWKLVWIISVPVCLLYMTCGRQLMGLLLDNPSEEALRAGILYLMILAPFYFVVSLKVTADGVLRGAGDMRDFMFTTFTDLLLRVALAFVFSRTSLGYLGIWLAWPIGWSAATVLSVTFYRRGRWKKFV